MLNRPYEGTIVPSPFMGHEKAVWSIMIEVNRSSYMDEITGERFAGFSDTAGRIRKIICDIESL
jgi:N-formylglutamate amidohydrolase